MKYLSKVVSTVLLVSGTCLAANDQNHLVSVHHSAVRYSVPIKKHTIYGTGICINSDCSVISAPYHVQAMAMGANLSVTGTRTTKVLSFAKESDTNRSSVRIGGGSDTLSYNIAKDISFVYTKKAVPQKSGMPYSYKCYVGQKIRVVGYTGGHYQDVLETREGHIIGCDVVVVMGQAEMTEDLVLDIDLNPGLSGSAVLDEQGNLLGMIVLSGRVKAKESGLEVSIALPLKTLAKALVELDPVLGATIFGDIPAGPPPLAQKKWFVYQEDELAEDTSQVTPDLAAIPIDVPNAVNALRARSDDASKRMVNVITTQCLAQGSQKPLCHELSILDDQQAFREIRKNGKLGKATNSFPSQKHGVWVGTDWGDALGEIADNPWLFEGSVDNHYLFTHKSSVEDDRCYWEEHPQGTPLFARRGLVWKGAVKCFEQVLTDREFNVIAVYTELHPPPGDCQAQLVQIAIYYDWVKLDGVKLPILLPARERITAKMLGQKDLWYANLSWTDYKKFRADHKIGF